MLAAIGVLIVAIVAGLYFYMDWQRSRPGTAPEELQVTATAGEQESKTTPFSVCEFGAECPEGTVARIDVGGSETIRVSVPKEVAEQQWTLLSIYDDPAANTDRTFAPGEASEAEVPVTTGDGSDHARIVVVEVSCLMVGHDADGAETPVVATWSFSAEPQS